MLFYDLSMWKVSLLLPLSVLVLRYLLLTTPSNSRNTSLFQKRITLNPKDSRKAVRFAS